MEVMTGTKSDRTALTRLANVFVDDVLNASDEDILAEAREDHPDPAAAAAQAKALFEKALILAGKGKLGAARTALAQHRVSASVVRLDPAAARRRLEQILTRDPDMAHKLTLAARKDQGQGLSDNDVQGLLDDLAELGILSEPGEQ
jgi:hypothetical protein